MNYNNKILKDIYCVYDYHNDNTIIFVNKYICIYVIFMYQCDVTSFTK